MSNNNKRKIVTLIGNDYEQSDLSFLINQLSDEEVNQVLIKLGLDEIFSGGGSFEHFYSLDISSSKPTYITTDFDITLEGNFFNYFKNINSEVESWQWERNSGNSSEDLSWALGKNERVLNLTKEDFPESFGQENVTFILKAKIGSKEITDSITFTKFQMFSKVQIRASENVFLDNSPQEIRLDAISDVEIKSYKWYVNNQFVSNQSFYKIGIDSVERGKSVHIKLEAKDKFNTVMTDYMSIVRLKDGRDGEDGVPGPPGKDGSPTYTWIKYADDDHGTNMSEYPTKQDGTIREWIGIATNKTTPEESNNYQDYTWSKYVGDQGIPGKNGYIWIKYSEYPDGRKPGGVVSMYDTPFRMEGSQRIDMVYMGIAYNKQTQQESNIPEDYTWSKIKGDDGHTNYVLDISNDNISIPVDANGDISNPTVAFSHARTNYTLYYGDDQVPYSDFSIEISQEPNNAFNSCYNHNHNTGEIKINCFNSNDLGGNLILRAKVNNKIVASGTVTITKIKGAGIYEIVPSSGAIKVKTSPEGIQIIPSKISAKIIFNNGSSISEVNTGILTYRYIFQSNIGNNDDGNQINIGQEITLSNSGDPLFIEFKYFHPETNVLVDKETIPFIRDGVSGTYEELRYAMNGSFTTPPSLSKTENEPQGWSLNPPSQTSSLNILWMIKASKYVFNNALVSQWSDPIRVSGPPGPSGPKGEPGTNGGDAPFLAPMGEWKNDKQYKGSDKRIEAVKYGSHWYVTRTDAGLIPIGTLPTDTQYWNQSDIEYDFIATNLFLATSAYIDNLNVRSLKTSDTGRRLEIREQTNDLALYTTEQSDKPVLKISADSSGSHGGGYSANYASITINDNVGLNYAELGTSGIFSSTNDGVYAYSLTTGANVKASIVGSTEGNTYFNNNDYNREFTSHSAVCGVNKIESNISGCNYGGYFNSCFVGGNYIRTKLLQNNDNYSIGYDDNTIIGYGSFQQVTLPEVKKEANGWCKQVGFLLKFYVVNSNSTLRINCPSSVKILTASGLMSQITLTRGNFKLLWDGNYWLHI